jgi:hypothetical protein
MKKQKKVIKQVNEKIFVQIAAYRDPELLPTLRNMLTMAKNPNNLTICIAWQHSKEDIWDTLDEFKNDSRFIILDIPHKESKGTCWARYQIQQQWKNEAYTLQLDSHHRFEKDWDATLIKMVKDLQAAGHKKPLLTAYVSSYEPKNDPAGRARDPWWLTFDRFTPQGAVFFIPSVVPDWQNRTLPYPSRFYSAHFGFTLGQFCKEVPHDPNYLFHGEEISIAARAYTWGYDLFSPHTPVVYHEYTREHRPRKSWDDLADWYKWDVDSLARNRRLLNIDGERDPNENFGKFGFGTQRTLEQYEQYAGIKFETRAVQQYTLDHKEAPNPYPDDEYLRVFKHCIDIPHQLVPFNDYDLWAVAFEDADGKELVRVDAFENEINAMKNDSDGYCKLWRIFHTSAQPKRWIVWPHSREHGWTERLTGEL